MEPFRGTVMGREQMHVCDRFDATGVFLESSAGLGCCSSVDCSSTFQERLIAHRRRVQQLMAPSTSPPALIAPATVGGTTGSASDQQSTEGCGFEAY